MPLRTIPPIGRLTATSHSPAKAPPPSKHQGRPLPDLAQPQIHPRGPAVLHLGQKRQTGAGGPGAKPPEFEGPQTEWVWHYASRKLYEPTEHLGVFDQPWGGITWAYQVPEGGGFTRDVGSSVSDFEYNQDGGLIIVRIEGFYDHVQRGGAAQQARDNYLIAHAGWGGDRVVRVGDDEFMDDITGNKAIRLLAQILSGTTPIPGLAGGTLEAPRYAAWVLKSS